MPGAAGLRVVDADVFGRLTADLTRNHVNVIVDLSGEQLLHALGGRPDIVKVSDEELADLGFATDGTSLVGAMEWLGELGARDLVVTRRGLATGQRAAIESRAAQVHVDTGPIAA
jgi:fructose-1-phosphate kinase PfkB-like protein